MVSVQVLDEYDDMQAKCDNNRVNLAIVSMISLRRGHPVSAKGWKELIYELTCLRVDKKSIIF